MTSCSCNAFQGSIILEQKLFPQFLICCLFSEFEQMTSSATDNEVVKNTSFSIRSVSAIILYTSVRSAHSLLYSSDGGVLDADRFLVLLWWLSSVHFQLLSYLFCSGVHTINFLKFRTLYSILFWLKFCFLCSGFFKYLVEWQTV